ncbi:hypothetical protein CANCADRAFT_108762 [Tortispora caseinolytica NRRL Y-17796]|uniref:DASH complex subunit ASK1 n=1 Tax=Tortispora caseinolytica NRRL Y-17796 TaxID=767744 RepID=A0A1E4TG12_9ASCO|nr:hypothetical protein CANCADRAFT_108762 [Tortispora caseinolytica NRRL Y-17796]
MSSSDELERLEQSITLCLQEIDKNFARAHRTVTSSIIPVVERYGEECERVYQRTKFWKQFFEASANVKLTACETEVYVNDDDEKNDKIDDDDCNKDKEVSEAATDDTSQFLQTVDALTQSTPLPTDRQRQKLMQIPKSDTPPSMNASGMAATRGGAAGSMSMSSPSMSPAISLAHARITPSRPIRRMLNSTMTFQMETPNQRTADFSFDDSSSSMMDPPTITAFNPRELDISEQASSSPRTPVLRSSLPRFDDTSDSSFPQMSPPITMQFGGPNTSVRFTPSRPSESSFTDSSDFEMG